MGASMGIRANLELAGELAAASSAGELGELGRRARLPGPISADLGIDPGGIRSSL